MNADRRLLILLMAVCPSIPAVAQDAAAPAPAMVAPAAAAAAAAVQDASQSVSVQEAAPAAEKPTDAAVPADGSKPESAAVAAPPAESPEVTQKKQQMLEQLTFDRRPSAIIRAWALTDEELVEAILSPAAGAAPNMPGRPNRNVRPVPVPDQAATPQPAPAATSTTPQTDAERAALDAALQKAKDDESKVNAFQKQVTLLKIAVTRAQWDQLKTLLSGFAQTEREKIYQKLLDSLLAGPPDSPRSRDGQIIGERNLLQTTDVIAIAEMSPVAALTVAQRSQLGMMTQAANREGEAADVTLASIKAHLDANIPDRKLTRRVAAQMLMSAGRAEDAVTFLPSLEEAQEADDLEALDMLTDSLIAMSSSKGKTDSLEQAWQVVQTILETPLPPVADPNPAATAAIPATEPPAVATPDVVPPQESARVDGVLTAEQRKAIIQKALQTAVRLAPKLKKELGEAWLAESFTAKKERGRRILSGIGTAVAMNMGQNGFDTNSRVETLKLQQTAVDAVLNHVKDDLTPWKPALNLMAMNWLREAVYSSQYDTSNSRGSRMNRDEFGNYYYVQDSVPFGSQISEGMPQAIPSGKLLDSKPSETWLTFLEPSFYPTYSIATARLHLRVKEEAEAFPHIEAMAKTNPKEARELLQNFIDVWSENHDPNNQRRRTNVYMYSFGYGERLNGIPLTRSHQQRNLTELSEWVRRIRALNLPDIDDAMFARPFMAVHSQAEVYRLDDMQAVFGELDSMSPKALASLLTTMQSNLGSVWRVPQLQQDSKTNRNQKEIEAEVRDGYSTAMTLCERGLSKHPKDWNLLRVQGALMHDLVVFQNDQQKSASFIADRTAAIRVLQSAAEAYLENCATVPVEERSVEAFNTWFYAVMGDSSIGQISTKRTPLLNELENIQSVLSKIPQEVQDTHRDMFANDLFTRMSSVNPAIKFRYIREGLKLVGDRPQAQEAKKVFEYYNDLVTEIQLNAAIDGTPNVGHEQPFGVLVSLRHTQAIERESGGFQRYLQNQKSGGGYYYNNGRPTEDYRDKFEEAAREALDEHFEVLSVTFEPETIRSRAEAEPGWRQTPYAYLLLKARGPEIDRIPPMRLDLDFLDTTGYVVLPVETPQLAINCSAGKGDDRPLELVSLTQTLDEREADKGKLSLEIKAVGKGVLPDLEQLVDLKFTDFEIAGVEDNKLSISKFDESSSVPVVLSEHLWTVSLKDKADNIAAAERSFSFPATLMNQGEVLFQRYDDADLKATESTIVLQRSVETATFMQRWGMTLLGLVVLIAAAVTGFFVLKSRRVAPVVANSRWSVPDEITPFSVLSLLRDIERNGTLHADDRPALTASITQIERYFFADHPTSTTPDLDGTARSWVKKAR